MKSRIIPSTENPWVCVINGKHYSYTPTGEAISVPDEVADLIDIINGATPRPAPIPGSAGDVWTRGADGKGSWQTPQGGSSALYAHNICIKEDNEQYEFYLAVYTSSQNELDNFEKIYNAIIGENNSCTCIATGYHCDQVQSTYVKVNSAELSSNQIEVRGIDDDFLQQTCITITKDTTSIGYVDNVVRIL